MKREENQTIEPMDIQNIVKDVKTIKTMILRARYTAAKMANAEMLKLYFATGAYALKRTREGQWGTGVIEEISRRLSIELPGLRGYSPQNIRNMRQFFKEWAPLLMGNPVAGEICQTVSIELAVRDMARPIGVATYRSSADVPEEYKVLAPLLDGARALLSKASSADDGKGIN